MKKPCKNSNSNAPEAYTLQTFPTLLNSYVVIVLIATQTAFSFCFTRQLLKFDLVHFTFRTNRYVNTMFYFLVTVVP